ncbi:MAG: glycosyltransferase [Bacteroidota bacterium]|nr:glycosyltransferase [Bacteroidota bacterium]
MTKIFITIPWFVPAFRAGGPVQSIANLVKEYREGVEYLVFCGDTDLNGAELENIKTNEWTGYNEYTNVWYAGPEKRSETLVKLIEREKPDILFIIGMFSWHFNIVPIMFCKGPRKILSSRGMLHPGALSQKKWKKQGYLQLFKMLGYHDKVDFHATDSEEAAYIHSYFGKQVKVFVAGNFPTNVGLLPFPFKEPGKLKLVSVAIISPVKNTLLILEALAKVKEWIEYDIYGPVNDEEYWDLCKEQIERLPGNIQVTYHKEIEPSRVKEVLEEAHVFILPSKSENFGHALYEALSAGRPVITSYHTPWKELLESVAGFNVSVKDTSGIDTAIRFFAQMNQEEMQKWSRGALAYAEKKLDVGKTREEYRRMFEG